MVDFYCHTKKTRAGDTILIWHGFFANKSFNKWAREDLKYVKVAFLLQHVQKVFTVLCFHSA